MHECTESCSWRQTPRSLLALGYDVTIPARDATVLVKAAADRTFAEARHQAFLDGAIRLCTRGVQ